MLDRVGRYLAGLDSQTDARALRPILVALADRYSSQSLSSAGLVIVGAASALAKTGAVAYQGIAAGVPVTIAAGTTLPALTGLTIAANAFNVACFFIDNASVVTVAFGTAGATLGAVVFPPFPVGKALVGYLIITNGTTFTGGTTALDAATVNFVSPTGPFDPSVLL